jgi:1-acyl-sn-glycerol-3-phosphate acyltransferase
MRERAKAAFDSGISLIAFAEGSRTRDGHVQEFKKGIFGLAQKFGIPIVPISVVGSYQFFQTGNWMLFPRKITVYLHATIETKDIGRSEVDDLRQRVQDIVAKPVEDDLLQNPVEKI